MMKTYSKMTSLERDQIHQQVDALIESLSEEFDACTEAVANTAFMRIQKHPTWGRNATHRHKSDSYSEWDGKCERCGQFVDRSEAVFHHLSRGVPNQHGPQNLVPHHNSCHDAEHGVSKGSITKGTRE
ncbi:MAG: hypothetical protein CME33_09375 [Gimesia sp.]|uniref:HNH endonuclease n=1 Tax=Gimesia sp. TaxID=2024833 RepID=UPI000C3DA486|nr:hypothetical protein [Gimesia sp.]|tara:strand:- start:82 stop:465 length:384 start_codon:yes stop_codon:yes gene_type:complete